MFRLIKTNGPTPFQLDKECFDCVLNEAQYVFTHYECGAEYKLCSHHAIMLQSEIYKGKVCVYCEEDISYGEYEFKKTVITT